MGCRPAAVRHERRRMDPEAHVLVKSSAAL
jgi:hypothetical protein